MHSVSNHNHNHKYKYKYYKYSITTSTKQQQTEVEWSQIIPLLYLPWKHEGDRNWEEKMNRMWMNIWFGLEK